MQFGRLTKQSEVIFEIGQMKIRKTVNKREVNKWFALLVRWRKERDKGLEEERWRGGRTRRLNETNVYEERNGHVVRSKKSEGVRKLGEKIESNDRDGDWRRMTKDKRMQRMAYKGSLAFFAIMQSGWILRGKVKRPTLLRWNVLDRLCKFPREGRAPQTWRARPVTHLTVSTLNWNYQTGCQAKAYPVCHCITRTAASIIYVYIQKFAAERIIVSLPLQTSPLYKHV